MKLSTSKEFGALIKKVRKEQGLTQVDLANVCLVSTGFISDLEKGKPSSELDKSLKVAAMLGINFEAQEPPKLNEQE